MSEQFVSEPYRIPPVADRYREADMQVIKDLATEQIMDASKASHALRALARAVIELQAQVKAR